MKEYNISALITIMMNAFADSQVNTGSILLQTVASHPNVNVDVDGKMVSNLMKRKTDIHGDIKSGAGKKEVIDFARNKVKETILSRINPVLIDDTCSDILKTMSTDSKVSDGFCSKMQQLYESQNMLDFFTNAVLYALSVTNLPPEASVQEGDFMLQAEQISSIRSKIAGFRRQRSRLQAQLKGLEMSKAEGKKSFQKDYQELLAFFPDIDVNKLEQVEEFHHRITNILNGEIRENQKNLEAMISLATSRIQEQKPLWRNSNAYYI